MSNRLSSPSSGMAERDPGLGRVVTLDARGEGVLAIVVGGVWAVADGLADTDEIERALAAETITAVVVASESLAAADSTLAVFLARVYDLCQVRRLALDVSAVGGGGAALLALARAVPERAGTDRVKPSRAIVDRIGISTLKGMSEFDGQLRFCGALCRSLARLVAGRARFRRRDLIEVLEEAGPHSLGIVTIISALIGMILAFIGAVQLRRFGAGIYVADLVGLATAREMAAVMTGIVIAGKTGAAFAARIGTMQAQEEIDALITLGVSPIDFLVLPRVLGLALMMPLLYLYACGVGLAGGMLVGTTVLDLSPLQYWQQTLFALSISQFVIGLSKSLVFGALVAIAGCMRGIQCGRSAAAVGEATTSAVVTGILYIIISDAIFAILLEVWGL
ncbi:phospholipid/cholesterol/gamma-HCH transport system permease protein [uncultured Gammaproteobacteria bacterium]